MDSGWWPSHGAGSLGLWGGRTWQLLNRRDMEKRRGHIPLQQPVGAEDGDNRDGGADPHRLLAVDVEGLAVIEAHPERLERLGGQAAVQFVGGA